MWPNHRLDGYILWSVLSTWTVLLGVLTGAVGRAPLVLLLVPVFGFRPAYVTTDQTPFRRCLVWPLIPTTSRLDAGAYHLDETEVKRGD